MMMMMSDKLFLFQCVREGKQLCCTPLPDGVLSDELRRGGGDRDK